MFPQRLIASSRCGKHDGKISEGRVYSELGGYAAILKRTPDTQDLVTATDSEVAEVLCRLVRRWIGQGGKASLANTADADILEFIIGKMRARIAANARTFLVKSFQWKDRTTDRAAHQWKEGTRSKTIRNSARRGAAESLMEDRLQRRADKWRTELFEPQLELQCGNSRTLPRELR